MRGPKNADPLARKRAFLVLVQLLKARSMGSNCDADPQSRHPFFLHAPVHVRVAFDLACFACQRQYTRPRPDF